MRRVSIDVPDNNYSVREALKTIRTNIMFCGEEKKVIMLTSCVPDEGKSTMAFQLAKSFGELGKRVVLIDADLRKSVMASSLGIERVNVGVSHFLSGQASLNDVLVMTNQSNLYMIFSGPSVVNSTELLSVDNFEEMIKMLRRQFDYIIVDTPPLGVVIDSAIVAKQCDGAVIVLEANKTKYRFAQNIKYRLEETGTPILGVILNKVDRTKQAGYYSRYYGKSGYGYYSKYEYYGNSRDRKKARKHKKK